MLFDCCALFTIFVVIFHLATWWIPGPWFRGRWKLYQLNKQPLPTEYADQSPPSRQEAKRQRRLRKQGLADPPEYDYATWGFVYFYSIRHDGEGPDVRAAYVYRDYRGKLHVKRYRASYDGYHAVVGEDLGEDIPDVSARLDQDKPLIILYDPDRPRDHSVIGKWPGMPEDPRWTPPRPPGSESLPEDFPGAHYWYTFATKQVVRHPAGRQLGWEADTLVLDEPEGGPARLKIAPQEEGRFLVTYNFGQTDVLRADRRDGPSDPGSEGQPRLWELEGPFGVATLEVGFNQALLHGTVDGAQRTFTLTWSPQGSILVKDPLSRTDWQLHFKRTRYGTVTRVEQQDTLPLHEHTLFIFAAALTGCRFDKRPSRWSGVT